MIVKIGRTILFLDFEHIFMSFLDLKKVSVDTTFVDKTTIEENIWVMVSFGGHFEKSCIILI